MNHLATVLGFMGVSYVFELWLNLRQRKLLHVAELPKSVTEKHKELREHIDAESFSKSQAYGRAKNLFTIVVDATQLVQDMLVLCFKAYPFVWALCGSLLMSNKQQQDLENADPLQQQQQQQPSEYLQSLMFLGIISLCHTTASLPSMRLLAHSCVVYACV